jgi:hypothetical protein
MKELKIFFSGTPKQLREFLEWSSDRYGRKTLKQLPHLVVIKEKK